MLILRWYGRVNGWFTTFWQLQSWDGDPTTAHLVLGKGGFHGGQPHMLDGIQKDGSIGGPDEFLPESNFTNPLDAPSMGGIMIQNLLVNIIQVLIVGYYSFYAAVYVHTES